MKALLRDALARGMSVDEQEELLSEFSPTPTTYEVQKFREEILAHEIREVQQSSPVECFVRFKMESRGSIEDLNEIVQKVKDLKPEETTAAMLTAGVSAIKAKQVILKEVLTQGQNLGVIHKTPETKVTLVGGVAIGNAPKSELIRLRDEKLEGLRSLALRGPVKHYLDEPDEDIYFGDKQEDPGETVETEEHAVIDITPQTTGRPQRRKVVSNGTSPGPRSS